MCLVISMRKSPTTNKTNVWSDIRLDFIRSCRPPIGWAMKIRIGEEDLDFCRNVCIQVLAVSIGAKRYYRYRKFSNTSNMKRYRHGALVCSKRTTSGVVYSQNCDFNIYSEVNLGDSVFMDVHQIICEGNENRL